MLYYKIRIDMGYIAMFPSASSTKLINNNTNTIYPDATLIRNIKSPKGSPHLTNISKPHYPAFPPPACTTTRHDRFTEPALSQSSLKTRHASYACSFRHTPLRRWRTRRAQPAHNLHISLLRTRRQFRSFCAYNAPLARCFKIARFT
jgi:hypothetical protein